MHCAAGKDRTGTLVALALSLAASTAAAIVDDYAASTERVEEIVGRLLASPTYADNLRDRPMSSHPSYPETMRIFLDHVDDQYGGAAELVERSAGRPRTPSGSGQAARSLTEVGPSTGSGTWVGSEENQG